MEKNPLKLIDEFQVTEKAKGCWIEICYADVLVLLCCAAAMFFTPLSLALAFLAMLYLELGLHGFILNRLRKQPVSYEDLFVSPRQFFKNFVLKLVYYATILLWSLLLIVPGVICALNFVFCEFICYEHPDLPAKEILARSRSLAAGYRFKLFILFLACLIIVCAGVAIGYGLTALLGMWLTIPIWVMAGLMILFGGILTIFIALPLYQTSLASCYLDALSRQSAQSEKSPAKKSKSVGNKK